MVSTVSGVFVPVEVLAHEQEVEADLIIARIQAGQLVGRQMSNGWHVLVQAPPSSGEAPAPVAAPAPAPPARIDFPDHQRVTVVDVRIPYWSAAVLFVKLILATVPAMVLALGAYYVYWKWGDVALQWLRELPI